MIDLLENIELKINAKIYVKNPETSPLGKRIINAGIELIEELGYNNFTFKKLAQKINTSEASIYRYFESKHKLLLYITSWYWAWMNYRLAYELNNISDPIQRLRLAITHLTNKVVEDKQFSHINEVKLFNVVVIDASKTFLTKNVDEENRDGAFMIYKDLVQRVANIILEIAPEYPYPQMLVSTAIEGAHLQRFFADHLPRLTNTTEKGDAITNFYLELIFKALDK